MRYDQKTLTYEEHMMRLFGDSALRTWKNKRVSGTGGPGVKMDKKSLHGAEGWPADMPPEGD